MSSTRATLKRAIFVTSHPTNLARLFMVAAIFALVHLWAVFILVNRHSPDLQLRGQLIFDHHDDSHEIEWREDGLDHCPNATIQTMTNKLFPVPTYIRSKTLHSFRIPPQILVNNLTDHKKEKTHGRTIASKFYFDTFLPGWKIIFDDEVSCFQKIDQVDLFKSSDVKLWFFSGVTSSNDKKDLCMLVQLFVSGGIFISSEYEFQISLLDQLARGIDALVLEGIEFQDNVAILSISALGAPPGHPLIQHALEIVYNYLFNGMELNFPGDYLGTGAITLAMQQTYKFSSYDTRDMICRGFYHGTFALSHIVQDVTAGKVELKKTKKKKRLQVKPELPPDKKLWLLRHKNHPNSTGKIPQYISMIYLQRDGQLMDENTNPAIKLAHDSWTIMNPEYDIRLFNLLVARKYLQEYFHPVFLRAFDCVQAFAGKADFFRLVVLYRDGGWYSDWKQKCVKKNLLADISRNNTLYIIRDNGNEYSRSHECYSNAFIGATPQHPVIAKSIEVILKNIRGNYYGAHALDATGPCAFGKAIREAKEQYDLNLDAMDGDFREDPPYSYFFRNDEKVIMHKCEDCGASQDWDLGNNYFELWWNKNYYCEDAASIFQ